MSGKTINLKLVSIAKYNRIMQPDEIAIKKTDYIKIHENLVNPTDITKEEVNIFQQKLLQSEGCSNVRNYTIATLIVYSGLRISELVALKHEDFAGATFKIRRTETRYLLEEGHYAYEVKDFPKSEAGVRRMGMPGSLRRLSCKTRLGNMYSPRTGKGLRPTASGAGWSGCAKPWESSPNPSPHKARKTYGTILLDNNIDQRLITELMGHTNISCTENHYHRNRKSMERKSDLVSGIPELQAK